MFGIDDLYITLIPRRRLAHHARKVLPGPRRHVGRCVVPRRLTFALVLDSATRERLKYLLGTVTGDGSSRSAPSRDGGTSDDGAQL